MGANRLAEASLVGPASPVVRLRDLVALTKPRITSTVLLTTAGGLWLAPGVRDRQTCALAVAGVTLIVSGANALNMYLERDVDGRMKRTERRPLPAGRLAPRVALVFGVALSVLAVPVLALDVNLTTAMLAVLAHLSYVLAYTPMKQRSHLALLVGAVPGAMPPLLGWTSATGRVTAGGLVLFGILYLWQVPHFLAIAMFREQEYTRAGLKVMPAQVGARATQHAIVRWTSALLVTTLLAVPFGVARERFLASAGLLGAVFLGWGLYGLRGPATARWARSLFAVSLVYLMLLFAALVVDARV